MVILNNGFRRKLGGKGRSLMGRIRLNAIVLVCFSFLFVILISSIKSWAEKIEEPISTYSIIAIDSESNEMGVAVQSHWFCVGPDVIWCEAGVGVVATQALVDISYGPEGLVLMGKGMSAQQALVERIKQDEGRDVRQVAYLDVHGNVAAYTGKQCIPKAGHKTGDLYSVQANIMSTERVWKEMARSFEKSKGPLAERLLQALEAGQAVGGDLRGKQSAAIKIVRIKPEGPSYQNVILDLRVDDHPEPLHELRRLVTIDRAYKLFYQGEEALESGNTARAEKLFTESVKLSPGNKELLFWQGLSYFNAGQKAKATQYFKKVLPGDSRWLELIKNLREVEMITIDENEISDLEKLTGSSVQK